MNKEGARAGKQYLKKEGIETKGWKKKRGGYFLGLGCAALLMKLLSGFVRKVSGDVSCSW